MESYLIFEDSSPFIIHIWLALYFITPSALDMIKIAFCHLKY